MEWVLRLQNPTVTHTVQFSQCIDNRNRRDRYIGSSELRSCRNTICSETRGSAASTSNAKISQQLAGNFFIAVSATTLWPSRELKFCLGKVHLKWTEEDNSVYPFARSKFSLRKVLPLF